MGRSPNARFEPRFHVWGLRLLLSHRRQGTLEELANIFVVRFLWQNPMAVQDAARISIHDEDGMISRVQKNRVRGLRTHAVQAEQLFAELVGRLRKSVDLGGRRII